MGNCLGGGKKVELIKVGTRELGEEQNMTLEQFGKGTHIKSTHQFFEIRFEDIKVLNSIGSGGSSAFVYKALWNEQTVAFKCFKTETTVGNHNYEEFEKEASIFSVLRHPNILNFYGCTVHPPRVGIVMEYCEYGDLEFFIKHHPKFPLSERVRVLSEVASAMKYLHSNEIIHRDLKLQNVLIAGKKLVAKVMDFGLSRVIETKSVTITKRIGTAIYMAPEVAHEDGKYDGKCDVYSFAMVMFICLSGNLQPFGNRLVNVQFKVKDSPNFRPPIKLLNRIPQPYRSGLVDIIKKSWNHAPQDRPTFEEILPELRKIKDSIPEEDVSYVEGKTVDPNELNKQKKRSASKHRSRMRSTRSRSTRPSRSNISVSNRFENEDDDGVLIFIRTPEKDDSQCDELILKEKTLEALRKLVCEWGDCEPHHVVKMCKKFDTSLRKISKDTTVSKMEANSVIVVTIDKTKELEITVE